MNETVEERLERLRNLGANPQTTVWDMSESDLAFLIDHASLVDVTMKASSHAIRLVNEENERLKEKSAQLVKDYNELFIQENAMQNNWKLAFFSAEKYKKCLDEITAAMNTERPAEEKTKDVRRILEGLK